jgi:hypothetical protein
MEAIKVKRVMNILNHKGHSELEWDSNNEIEIKNMEEKFKEMLGKGYTAFKVDAKTKKSKKITKFDPIAEEITMTPPARKG